MSNRILPSLQKQIPLYIHVDVKSETKQESILTEHVFGF